MFNYTLEYTKAYAMIIKLFDNRIDKGGNPYIGHLLRVCDGVSKEADSKVADKNSTLGVFYKKAEIVALLHDAIEDTNLTTEDLKEAEFDQEIIDAIDAISRRDDEKYYFDFIERVNKNDIARIVKIHDLEDNMNIMRLDTLDDSDLQRVKKYWYCWKYLKGEISTIECNNVIHPDRKMR